MIFMKSYTSATDVTATPTSVYNTLRHRGQACTWVGRSAPCRQGLGPIPRCTHSCAQTSLPPQPLAQALPRHETHRARHMREARAIELLMNAIGPLLGRHAPPFAHYNCLAVSRGVHTARTAHLFYCSPHMSCRSSRTFYSRFYAPCERVPAAATHRAARLNRQDPCRSSCATRPMHTSGPMRTRSARAQMPRRARERKTTPTRATIPGTCAASSWSPCPSGYASTPQLTQRPSLARGAARC